VNADAVSTDLNHPLPPPTSHSPGRGPPGSAALQKQNVVGLPPRVQILGAALYSEFIPEFFNAMHGDVPVDSEAPVVTS